MAGSGFGFARRTGGDRDDPGGAARGHGQLSERLPLVLDELARTCQGWVVTEAEVEGFLLRLANSWWVLSTEGDVSSGIGDPRCQIIIFMGKTDPQNPDR